VGRHRRLLASELASVLVPRDLEALGRRRLEVAEEVEGLLASGRGLVETAERLVCRLYGLPPELEDRVIEHAVTRSAGTPALDEA